MFRLYLNRTENEVQEFRKGIKWKTKYCRLLKFYLESTVNLLICQALHDRNVLICSPSHQVL
jgi:hypothetical protein